eukprot:540507-Hanusia_phi.AAC.4
MIRISSKTSTNRSAAPTANRKQIGTRKGKARRSTGNGRMPGEKPGQLRGRIQQTLGGGSMHVVEAKPAAVLVRRPIYGSAANPGAVAMQPTDGSDMVRLDVDSGDHEDRMEARKQETEWNRRNRRDSSSKEKSGRLARSRGADCYFTERDMLFESRQNSCSRTMQMIFLQPCLVDPLTCSTADQIAVQALIAQHVNAIRQPKAGWTLAAFVRIGACCDNGGRYRVQTAATEGLATHPHPQVGYLLVLCDRRRFHWNSHRHYPGVEPSKG